MQEIIIDEIGFKLLKKNRLVRIRMCPGHAFERDSIKRIRRIKLFGLNLHFLLTILILQLMALLIDG
jgi:hypothetical protein